MCFTQPPRDVCGRVPRRRMPPRDSTTAPLHCGREELMDSEMNNDQGPNIGIWIGIAVGAAVGIGIALSRRKRSRWDSARELTHRVAEHSGDFADATRGIVERVRNIYDESMKVVEDASSLWQHGRKLVRH